MYLHHVVKFNSLPGVALVRNQAEAAAASQLPGAERGGWEMAEGAQREGALELGQAVAVGTRMRTGISLRVKDAGRQKTVHGGTT